MNLLELTRIYYPSMGGMERFIYDRSKIYESLGIQYAILSTDLHYDRRDYGIEVKNVKYLKQFSPYNIVPTLPFRLSDKYDVISVNALGRFPSDYAIFHYAKKRQKIILTPYFDFHSNNYSVIKNAFKKTFFPALLDAVDAIIVFSQIEKMYWVDRYAVDEKKIYVIPPYITINPRRPSSISDDKYLLYLGRSEVNKLTDLLLKAFLVSKDIRLKLKLSITPGDVDPMIRDEVLRDKRIELLGFVGENAKTLLLEGCEALVFPTQWESFGYVAFEASAYEKPLVCSDLPLLRELHDSQGSMYFKNDIRDMSTALRKFSELPAEQKTAMGKLNLRNLNKYRFESVSTMYMNLFSTLLK